MSTKSKLLAMTEGLQLPAESQAVPAAASAGQDPAPDATTPATPAVPQFPPVMPRTAPRTGPGQMLQFRGQMLAAEGELEKLRAQLQQHEGSTPTRKLDPRTVHASRWANRHPDSFAGADFARLRQDIELAGGNVQAIAVRPSAEQPGHHEIVFGHRRHRACLELGLPVLATIETAPMSEHELFAAMDRENRERADLSPYEQGTMYRRALDEKLYPSNRRLAEALGVSHTWVANVLLVADLPPPVLECFRSPLEVQHRHARILAAALEKDRKGVLRRAEKLRAQHKSLAAAAIVTMLVGAPEEPAETPPAPVVVDGQTVGRWHRDAAGRLHIQIEAAAVRDGGHEAIAHAIAQGLVR